MDLTFTTSRLHGLARSLASREQLPVKLGVGVAAVGVGYCVYQAWRNYQTWLAMGAGGVPHNLYGWALQWYIAIFRANRDMTSTDMYEKPEIVGRYGSLGGRSFLREWGVQLPERARPHVYPFVVPQRQAGPGSPPAIRKLQQAQLDALLRGNAALLEAKTSHLEKRGAGVFLRAEVLPGVPPHGRAIAGEVGHYHLHAEGSSHWCLSLADAQYVVAAGWGQRHMMSGQMALLPHGYTLLYAPRSPDEVALQAAIVRASVAFMSGGQHVA